MKTVVRGISLFLATVLSVGVFAACDSSDTGTDDKEEKILTVEEVLEKIKAPENVKMSFETEIDMEMFGAAVHVVMTLEGEQDGDLMHQIMTETSTMQMDGEEATQTEKVEVYQKIDGSNATVYTKDKDTGSWLTSTSSAEGLGTAVGMDDMDDLFKSENFGEYDKSTGRYTLKEGVSVAIDDKTITAGYIECENGSYTLYIEGSMGEGSSYKMTVKYYDFGKVSQKLPAEIGE